MLFVVDIGNTNIVMGLFEGGKLGHSWRVSTRREQTSHEYSVLCRNLFSLDGLTPECVNGVAISSVVPPLNDCFEQLAKGFFKVNPLFVEPACQDLMPIRYHHPSDVGADRIVNALAAYSLHGGPAIVVDFGTATTFDAVSPSGEYLGGIIAPGIGISAEALFLKAARLPKIEIRRPAHAIGQTTVESMQSGVFYGYIGLVEGILRRMKAEMGSPIVIATGGLAKLIATEYQGFDHIEEDLTLQGLRLFYERSRQGS